MSDFSHAFNPWEDFDKGVYLAGVECREDAEAPDGWTKWIIPGYEYIYIEFENDSTFYLFIFIVSSRKFLLIGAACLFFRMVKQVSQLVQTDIAISVCVINC